MRKVMNEMGQYLTDAEVVTLALAICTHQFGADNPKLESPKAVQDYLRLSIANLEHEVFVIVFLSAQHRVIAIEELFRGSLTQTSVYPREVVKRALAHNAGAVILAHNHPSGEANPSAADRSLTKALAAALALVDVRVLDHVIVAPTETKSFAEEGLMPSV